MSDWRLAAIEHRVNGRQRIPPTASRRDQFGLSARLRCTVERRPVTSNSIRSVGYDAAAEVAKEAYASGRTVREVAREKGVLSEAELEKALDPRRMTAPGV